MREAVVTDVSNLTTKELIIIILAILLGIILSLVMTFLLRYICSDSEEEKKKYEQRVPTN